RSALSGMEARVRGPDGARRRVSLGGWRDGPDAGAPPRRQRLAPRAPVGRHAPLRGAWCGRSARHRRDRAGSVVARSTTTRPAGRARLRRAGSCPARHRRRRGNARARSAARAVVARLAARAPRVARGRRGPRATITTPMSEMSDRYEPGRVEGRWYDIWEKAGYFHAETASTKKPYCIVIPPPNVTGSLHMGHAFNMTLQDILIRYKRMDGFNALWMPGTDHAGIATQYVVERQLASEGKTKEDLGRQAFVERVWRWKEESGGTIIKQLKRLGASCDWERERFTMDPGLSAAVREVFAALWEEGLIYQGDYIVNWCPRCQTVLADLEVEREERDAEFVYIKYGPLTLGTVRPETKLGDTAVA